MIFDAYTNWLDPVEALNSRVSPRFRVEFVPLVKRNKCAEISKYKITSTPLKQTEKQFFICNDLFDYFKLGGNLASSSNFLCDWHSTKSTEFFRKRSQDGQGADSLSGCWGKQDTCFFVYLQYASYRWLSSCNYAGLDQAHHPSACCTVHGGRRLQMHFSHPVKKNIKTVGHLFKYLYRYTSYVLS